MKQHSKQSLFFTALVVCFCGIAAARSLLRHQFIFAAYFVSLGAILIARHYGLKWIAVLICICLAIFIGVAK